MRAVEILANKNSLKKLTLLSMVLPGLYATGTGNDQPNIVFIYADDLGWSDVGVLGAKYYSTPNIDKLANEGVLFTNAYSTSPNCAPSRGALMSGQYCGRTGMYNVSSPTRGIGEHRSLDPPSNNKNLALSKITIGQAMQEAGYQTVYFGKWHIGYGKDHLPNKRGFDPDDSFVIYKPSNWAHFHNGPAGNTPFQFKPYKNPDDIPDSTYLSDYLTDAACTYMEKHHADTTPFFLMLCDYLVHGPLNAPEENIAKYIEKEPDGKDHNPVFGGMVDKLDQNVGRVYAKLDSLGILENTVIIFYSDNGGVGGYVNTGIKGNEFTSNLPLRGGKTQLYEGGIRVPMIFYWKGHFQENKTCDKPVTGFDFYPTLLDIAGKKKEDIPLLDEYILDGESMYPLIKSPDTANLTRKYLCWHFPAYCAAPEWRTTPMAAIRKGDWKLVEHYVGEDPCSDRFTLVTN